MNAPARIPTAETSVTVFMAEKVGMLPEAFEATVRRLCMPPHHRTGQEASREEFAAFLLVCKHHELNPLTREIFAMPQKTGGFVPVVSVDGWLKLVNRHPQMDGMEFEENTDDKGVLVSATCRIYRKDRRMPISVTEYFAEVKRNTDPWRDMPHRMLRHKAMIQCARYAFGFAGIYDEDEAQRIVEAVEKENAPPPAPPVDLPDMRRAAPPAIEHKPAATPAASPAPEQPAAPVPRTQAVGAEVPASAPDNSAGAPAGSEPVDAEVYDGERQLTEIGNQLASVRTLDEVGEVEQAYADTVEGMSRTDRERAAHLFEQARERLTPADPAKTEAAPEGESLIEDWAAYESRMRRLADGTNTPAQADGLRKVWNGSKKYRTLMHNKDLVTKDVRLALGKYVEAALHRAEDVAGGQAIPKDLAKPSEPQPDEPATVSAAPSVTATEPEVVRTVGGEVFEALSKATTKEQAYLVWARSADKRGSCGASAEVLTAWDKEYREIRKRLPSEDD